MGDSLPPRHFVARDSDIKAIAAFFGDPNPLHVDRIASRTIGCERGLVNQGPTNIAFAMNGLLEHCSNTGLEIARMKVRLRSPVQGSDCVVFGGQLTTVGPAVPSLTQSPFSDGDVHCEVWLDRVDATRVLDGMAILRTVRKARPAEIRSRPAGQCDENSSARPQVSLSTRSASHKTESFLRLPPSNYEIKGHAHDYLMPILQAPALKCNCAHPIFAYYAAQAAFGCRVDAMYSELGVPHHIGMLLGEVDMRLDRQLQVGEVLGVHARLGDPVRKTGRSGRFNVVLEEVWLHDIRGIVAFLAVTLVIPT